MTDQDAKLDGLNSKDELIRELKKLYGNLNDDDTVTIIEFKVTELLDIPENAIWSKITPHEIAKLALEHLDLSDSERKILDVLIKTRSLRRTAKKLFGDIRHRWRIRKLLKSA